MALKIEQTWAQIGLRTSQPQLKLQTKESQVQIRESLPEIKIKQTDVKIQCDATQCREEIGLSTPLNFARKVAREAWQESLTYIAQKARTGDMMAQIAKYDISSIMANLGAQAFDKQEFNLTRIPKSPVRVEVTPGVLRLNCQPGNIQLQANSGDVIPSPVPGEIKMYLRQQGSIAIEYLGENMDALG